jgi:hypothetical protein
VNPLSGRDLSNTVITMDDLLTQRELAQQIVSQQGDDGPYGGLSNRGQREPAYPLSVLYLNIADKSGLL